MFFMDRVRKILAETFRVSLNDITDNTSIEEIDTWDSLTHIEMVVALESQLGLEFDGDEIAEMISVEMIEKIIKEKL